MRQVKYRKLRKYKYQIWETFCVQTPILGYKIVTPFITLFKNGKLMIKQGYASDGPSGPTFDTHTFMRAAFVHDALYQLLRMNKLPQEYRDVADRLLQTICLEDNMWPVRARWAYEALKQFGNSSAAVQPPPKIYTAPSGNKFHKK